MKIELLKFAVIAVLGASIAVSCNSNKSQIPTNKKEIMDRFLDGTLDESYVPAAFFIHFGNGKTQGDAAVQAQLEYFLASNMDILKVQFEQRAPYVPGLDADEGWSRIEPMPEDFYRPTLEIITRLQNIAGKDAYVLPTVYNAHQLATQSLGPRRIMQGAKDHPAEMKALFDSYEKALLWLVKECKKAGIEGFYMTTQGGEKKFYVVDGFFDNFIKPYDMTLMTECCRDTKLNILHICDWEGTFDDLTRYKDYPGQIVNTPINLDGTPFTLQDGVELFGRPVLGGLNRQKEILSYSETDLAAVVDSVLTLAPKGKTMLGAECTVSTAPLGNIHTAVWVAHHRK